MPHENFAHIPQNNIHSIGVIIAVGACRKMFSHAQLHTPLLPLGAEHRQCGGSVRYMRLYHLTL